MNGMAVCKDLDVANQVKGASEYGWFNQAFHIYGVTYIKENQQYFMTTSNGGKIYSYLQEYNLNDIYPSNVFTLEKNFRIVDEMELEYEVSLKIELSKQMQNCFPKHYLEWLNEMANEIRSDSAYPVLLSEQERLENCFDIELLKNFDRILDYSYGCLTLNKEHYELLKKWVKAEKNNVGEDYLQSDLFQKDIYGIGIWDNGRTKYIVDTQQETVMQRTIDYEMKGKIVTPIWNKTCGYNYQYVVKNAREDFKRLLEFRYDKTYMEQLHILRNKNSRKYRTVFEEKISGEHDVMVSNTLKHYGGKWGVFDTI